MGQRDNDPQRGTRLSPKWRPFVPGTRNPSHPEVPGFTFLGVGEFACHNDVEGTREFAVPVYRCDAMLEALLNSGHLDGPPGPGEAPDTEFVLLPLPGHDGRFRMGAPLEEAGRPEEEPHEVQIASPFLMARTAVTQRVYDAIAGERSDFRFPGDLRPADDVSWDDATGWCEKSGLRLPTEAEWELACRGGTQTPFAFGSGITLEQVNYHHFDDGQPVEVGSLPMNAFGLFEMHGNVREWCQDAFTEYTDAPVDGTAHELADRPDWARVLRGGKFDLVSRGCRSASRSGAARDYRGPHRRTSRHPGPGFRAARSVG